MKKSTKSNLHSIIYTQPGITFTLQDALTHLEHPPSGIFHFVKKKEYDKLIKRTTDEINRIAESYKIKNDDKLRYFLIDSKTEKASGAGRFIGEELKKYDNTISQLLTMYGASQSGI